MIKALNKLLPVTIVLTLAFLSVWKIVTCPTCVADYGRDGFFANWNIYTAGTNLYGLHSGTREGLFGGNMFYPYKNVLAYSDLNILTGLWVYPVAVLFMDSMISSGITIVAGQILTMLVLYLWWLQLSNNKWAAMLGAAAFGLSQFRFQYQVHVQMWSMQYWLAGAALVCLWLTDKKKKDWKLFLGTALLGLQVWESIMPVYFAGLIIALRMILLANEGVMNRGIIKKLVWAALIFGVISLVPLKTYWQVSREFNFQRSIRDAAHYGLSVNDLWKIETFTSTGLYILTAAALIQIIKRKNWNREVIWLCLVLIIGFVLALGPTLKWDGKTVKILGRVPVPLPYAAAYYLVPGFSAIRTSSRWIWVAGFGASGLIAIAMNNVSRETGSRQAGQFTIYNWKKRTAIMAMLVIAILGGTRISQVRKMPDLTEAPEVYKWLSGQPGKAIVILPMEAQEWEEERLPFSFVHNKRTVNGYSSFYPAPLAVLGKKLTAEYPSAETQKSLSEMKVDWVVIDKEMYNLKCKMEYSYCGQLENIRKNVKNPSWEDEGYMAIKII